MFLYSTYDKDFLQNFCEVFSILTNLVSKFLINLCQWLFKVWQDDQWLKQHAGETLENLQPEPDEIDTDASEKRPADSEIHNVSAPVCINIAPA